MGVINPVTGVLIEGILFLFMLFASAVIAAFPKPVVVGLGFMAIFMALCFAFAVAVAVIW